MDETELLEVVRALTNQPTAPFHEDAVRSEIIRQLSDCQHVHIEFDDFGNLIARYRFKTGSAPHWAFAAHIDHPGWVRESDGKFRFLGSVADRFLLDAKKREFGDFAMWDLPAFEVRERQIHSRACDDLLGCAEIICTLRELEESATEIHCLGLFTRAEEVGFVGAIELARASVVPKGTTIFSLETSTPRGGAEMGHGPIIRVGDRLSIFDSVGTTHLLDLAAANEIPVQRCLLDGGACEATAYQVYGYRCVAASLALGNYHNCAPDGTIGCEYVAVDDYANMVRLCLAVARSPWDVKASLEALRQKLETRAQQFQPHYRPLA